MSAKRVESMSMTTTEKVPWLDRTPGPKDS
jgi:hypothetical protein